MELKRTDIVFITVLIHLSVGASFAARVSPGKYYHLAKYDRSCHVTAEEGATVDLICQHQDSGSRTRPPCRLRDVHWQRLGFRTEKNVTASSKYGVWRAEPDWGLRRGKHVSLLRIRDLHPDDLGTYRCEVMCTDEEGRPTKAYHYTDVCLKQPNAEYAICSGYQTNEFCPSAFWNGVCDLDCDTERHLFDGYECAERHAPCDPSPDTGDAFCASRFANGVCDTECNTATCAWDGGDCMSTETRYADDTLVLYLARTGWPKDSDAAVDLKEFGRSLSTLLRTVVRVQPTDWFGPHSAKTDVSDRYDAKSRRKISYDRNTRTYTLFLRLDNTMCKKNCFKKAGRAAQFLTAALEKGWDPGIPILAVAVLSRMHRDMCHLENNTLLNVDLDVLDRQFSYSSSSDDVGGDYSAHSWIVVAAIASGGCLLILVIVLVCVACRMRKSPPSSPSLTPDMKMKYPSKYVEAERVHTGSYRGLPGIDV